MLRDVMVRMAERLGFVQAWRARQPALVRWPLAAGLLILALAIRLAFGSLHGVTPALSFYPAILVSAVLLGWKEAVAVLVASVLIGSWFFVPLDRQLLPVAWIVVGGFNIAIIAGLQHLTQELTNANERQRVLFRELQHRVANSLQAVTGTFELAQQRVDSSPTDAARLLRNAAARFAAAADVHRRLNDPALFQRGLDSILQDAVATAVDRSVVDLRFEIEPLALTLDQMSTLTMLVIEAANNAQKHVFQHGRGSLLHVSLQAQDRRRALLTIADDGTGDRAVPAKGVSGGGLGMSILEGLVHQIDGTLSVRSDRGTEIRVAFPLRPATRPADRQRF